MAKQEHTANGTATHLRDTGKALLLFAAILLATAVASRPALAQENFEDEPLGPKPIIIADPEAEPVSEPVAEKSLDIDFFEPKTMEEFEAWASDQHYIEVKANVVKISEGAVYVNKGSAAGVVQGLPMIFYDSLEVIDLDGSLLGVEETMQGVLKVSRVFEEMSSAEIISMKKQPERGGLVRLYVPSPDKPGDGELNTDCPAEMQFVPQGSFSYVPGALSRDMHVEKEVITEETGNFCVDIEPDDDKKSWRDARDFCRAQEKRLCLREEMHKTCAQHARIPHCEREDFLKGQCDRGTAVKKFNGYLEWNALWDEPTNDGAIIVRTGSCSCTGTMSACSTCYYPECRGSDPDSRGAKKKFRCCKDPE